MAGERIEWMLCFVRVHVEEGRVVVQVLWSSVAEEAYGSEKGLLAGLKIRSLKDDTVSTMHGGPCLRPHPMRLKVSLSSVSVLLSCRG